MVDPLELIAKYYLPGSASFDILVGHSRAVAGKSLEIAQRLKHLGPDLGFIEEAAILHDIGIFMTKAPSLGCFGDKPYICHGYLGRELLESEGMPGHALVCERHVGVGISLADIEQHHLPLPGRDMLPITLEEKIICFADKFFSKSTDTPEREKPLSNVRKQMLRYGPDKLRLFDEMAEMFL